MAAQTVIALLVLALPRASARPAYVHLNPNGNAVPNAPAIGHVDPAGGGALNPYGSDFDDAAHVYTAALCALDSDGDGQTNGFELGDECCRWNTTNKWRLNTTAISHPGDPSITSSRPPCSCAGSGLRCSCCDFVPPSPSPSSAPFAPAGSDAVSVPLSTLWWAGGGGGVALLLAGFGVGVLFARCRKRATDDAPAPDDYSDLALSAVSSPRVGVQ